MPAVWCGESWQHRRDLGRDVRPGPARRTSVSRVLRCRLVEAEIQHHPDRGRRAINPAAQHLLHVLLQQSADRVDPHHALDRDRNARRPSGSALRRGTAHGPRLGPSVNLAEPRTRYAVDVLGDMFPGAVVTPADQSAGSGERTFALAPSASRPRLLVPTTPRDAAGAALRAYGGRLTRGARLSYGAAARAVAIGGPAILRARLVAAGPSDSI